MEDLRPLLIVYAYNIIGTYDEAKDIVQDVYLKFTSVDQSSIIDKKAYLVRMVINLAIDQKRKQKKLREQYPGEWLPEPIYTDSAEHTVFKGQVLSYSVMVLLERLSSRQRAVFILKEAFDYEHEEIADVLGITVENSRQLLSRAKKDIHATTVQPGKMETAVLNRYLAVLQNGDVKALEKMLHDEITMISDGGGKAAAVVNTLHGAATVTKLLQGLQQKVYGRWQLKQVTLNHQPAVCYFNEGHLESCLVFAIVGDCIQSIYTIRNPDKLKILENSLR
ncbi:sigma-70 family RNA polymerase sigma factor [Pseudochryseolinea flava]|uniref:RNA polymerase subunit sigma-70 n=1 Tax=Pseudochryseolinea flava TaxID=2059302 RepID=A0A364XWT1_9BACT|nr:sigma-70 family RNA polymerase sigma factor [Pseudochryseolinea flava]RAV98686.1 RNA polymerase subunit sigma-70 [Pseudochryseolinea flava]